MYTACRQKTTLSMAVNCVAIGISLYTRIYMCVCVYTQSSICRVAAVPSRTVCHCKVARRVGNGPGTGVGVVGVAKEQEIAVDVYVYTHTCTCISLESVRGRATVYIQLCACVRLSLCVPLCVCV